MKTIIILIFTLMVSSCGDSSKNINKEFNKEGEELLVSITAASSYNEMKHKAWNFEKGIQGQALYSPNDNKCEIIIYEPIKIDDEATLTLGHELMHCLYGDYHD